MAITVSVLQGGANSHQTTSEEINFDRTDLMSPGVVGVLTNTSGVAPMTGGFAVNAQGSPDMTVAVSAGVGNVTATPTSGNSQLLRVKNSASTNVTISANASGGTRYDWLYIKVDPDKAKDPNSGASDVATLVTSRSTSSTTDNGTPPTYGTLIAVITVSNGASSITNGNIADWRVRSVAVGGINDTNGNEVIKVSATASAVNEFTVTNAATGNPPALSATGSDTNIPLKLSGKGTGAVQMFVNGVDQLGAWQSWTPTWTNVTIGNATVTAMYNKIGKTIHARMIVVWGTTTSASGTITFSLPETSVAYAGTAGTILIGQGAGYDVSASTVYQIAPVWNSTTTAKFNVFNASSTYAVLNNMTNTVPTTWANTDEWHCEFFYEAA